MSPDDMRRSKILSLILRHKPETVGLTLEAEGWVAIDALLAALARRGKPMTRSVLERVVAGNDKQRFAISADGLRIRAVQGHSRAVELGLVPVAPPAALFHGTVERFLAPIRAEGLRAGKRQYVHLSFDRATAGRVGARRGSPVILVVDAARLAGDGHSFFRAENGVWLCAAVPPRYITFP
jgi:putative RNA 2'-phosphotransferase